MARLVILASALVLAAFVIAGCGGAEDETPAPRESPTAGARSGDGESEPSPSPSPEGAEGGGDAGGEVRGIDALRGATTRPVTGEPTGRGTALLTRVALGRHEGFDRVVLQFREHLPGYRVRHVSRPVTEDGSGRRLRVDGNAIVEIRLEPASSYDLDRQQQTFRPRRLDGRGAGTSVVREVVRSGDFEAVLTWVVGLGDRVDYRVSTLRSPPRLVIDFRNH